MKRESPFACQSSRVCFIDQASSRRSVFICLPLILPRGRLRSTAFAITNSPAARSHSRVSDPTVMLSPMLISTEPESERNDELKSMRAARIWEISRPLPSMKETAAPLSAKVLRPISWMNGVAISTRRLGSEISSCNPQACRSAAGGTGSTTASWLSEELQLTKTIDTAKKAPATDIFSKIIQRIVDK